MVISSVIFVCMGNICRSPVAEAVARAEFARAGLELRVASAGTHGYHIGDGADPRSIASARAHGYDLSAHRAAQVDAGMLAAYDAVLVMDRVNLRDIARYSGGLKAAPQLFLPFAGVSASEEVPDPYYGGAQDFERVIELARAGALGLIRRNAMAHNEHAGRGSTA